MLQHLNVVVVTVVGRLFVTKHSFMSTLCITYVLKSQLMQQQLPSSFVLQMCVCVCVCVRVCVMCVCVFMWVRNTAYACV